MNAPVEIGTIEAIFRYPVKSMAGERLETASLGWYGLQGDRRFALRRMDDRSGMPWLTASRLPELLLFTPQPLEDGAPEELPTHVRSPDGVLLSILGDALVEEVARRHGAPVQMMQLQHGIFDAATLSVITLDTMSEIGRLAGHSADMRRFRPNIAVRSLQMLPFQEDAWLGKTLCFGEGIEGPAISVTMRDVRCSMVNFDPDSAHSTPSLLKAIVRTNQNNAGVYGTVIRTGELAVGQPIYLHSATA